MGGAMHFVMLIDGFSQKVWEFLLKGKDEALLMFWHFVTLVETQIDKKAKCLRLNNGGDYVSKAF